MILILLIRVVICIGQAGLPPQEDPLPVAPVLHREDYPVLRVPHRAAQRDARGHALQRQDHRAEHAAGYSILLYIS